MSRFGCTTSTLNLRALLTRRTLATGLVGSVALHSALTGVRGLAAEERIAKPLTTQFVKRQPRLTKPLELKKRPQPKHRRAERTMVAVKARAEQRDMSWVVLPVQLVGALARPRAGFSRAEGLEAAASEPKAVAQAVIGTMEASQAVDLSLEMLDLDALDTGKYHAMVIQDPNDKRSIRGFLHLSFVEIPTMATMRRSTSGYTEPGIASLIRAVNERTDIRADLQYRGDFNSQELFKTPWIYGGTAKPFELTPSELGNLGRYLAGGGFFFAEEWIHVAFNSFEGARRAFWHMFAGALATRGYGFERDWVFERLRSQHPIFHCFFDFGGLPEGYVWSDPKYTESGLDGAILEGRLVGTFDHKTLISAWCGLGSERQQANQKRALEFGVNTIVFALTQEGSITHRVMEEVR